MTEAIQQLKEALTLSPDNVPLRLHLADMLTKDAEWDEAAEEYQQVLNRSYGNTKARKGLAQVYYKQKKYSAAIIVYEALMKDKALSWEEMVDYMRCLIKEQSHGEAVEIYKKVLEQNPSFQDDEFDAILRRPSTGYDVNFEDEDEEELDDLLGDVNSQMGTGSTDFIFNAMYNIHLGIFGINTTANYKVNTINSSNFRYGDRFSINSFAYYQTKAGKGIFMAPNIGLLYLHNGQNNLAKTKVNETGGYVVSASAGLDINIRNVTVGTNVQLPFAQNFAHHQTDEKVSGLVHVTYTF